MKHLLIRFQVFALPFFVILLLFSGPVMANEAAQLKAENDKIDQRYQTCLIRSQIAFSEEEKALIQKNRKWVNQELSQFQNSISLKTRQNYEKTLARLVGDLSSQFSARTFIAYEGIVAEANLRRLMSVTVGLNSKAYQRFSYSFAEALFNQKQLDVDQFEKERKELVDYLTVESMNRTDKAMGLTVPTSLTMTDPQNVAATLSAINVIAEMALRVQTDNVNLRKDQKRYNRARARQVALGVGGFAVIIGTTVYAAPIVTTGGLAAKGLGMSTLIGEMGAGSAIGISGGAATAAVQMVYQIVSRAYFQSLEFSTPFSCELQRVGDQENLAQALKDGAVFGGAIGAGGTALAAIIPKITLWLMGGAVVVGQGNEVVSASYETYQMVSYYNLAQELADLESVPDSMKSEQMNLVRAALTKTRTHAKNAGRAAVDGFIIGTLSYAFFIDGQFQQALREGASLVKGIAAYSSDTLPSVTYSVSLAGSNALEQIKNPAATSKKGELYSRAQEFIAKVKVTSALQSDKMELKLVKP